MRRAVPALAAAFALSPVAAQAHGGALSGSGRLAGWTLDPLVLVPLLLLAAAYWHGLERLRAMSGRAASPWRAGAFIAGIIALPAAVLTPLDLHAERLLTAHMVQHLLIASVSAPLIVLARPGPAIIAGLPARLSRRAVPLLLRLSAAAGVRAIARSPFTAWACFAAVFFAWHIPAPYDAAIRDARIHTLEHFSFFFGALIFWAAVLPASVRGGGAVASRIGVVALMMAANTALALALVLSASPWYGAYAGQAASTWGLDPLEDQRLAGVVMWVFDDLVYLAAGSMLAFRWIDALGRRADAAT